MKLREWLHFFNIDRHIWICVYKKTSDGKIKRYFAPGVTCLIMSRLGWNEIVQAKITEKGNLWILIK